MTATKESHKLIEEARAAKATADQAGQALIAGQGKVAQLCDARIKAQSVPTPDVKRVGQLKKDYELAMGKLDELDIEAKAKGADTALRDANDFRSAHYAELLEDMKPEANRIRRELVDAIHHLIDLSGQWDALNGEGHQLVVASAERITENTTQGHSLSPELQRLQHVGGSVTEIESALPHWSYRDRRIEQQRQIAEQQAAEQTAQHDRHERAGAGI